MANPLSTIKTGLKSYLRDKDTKELQKVAKEQKEGKGSSFMNTDWGAVDRATNRIRGVRKQSPISTEGPLVEPKKYFKDIEEATTPELRNTRR